MAKALRQDLPKVFRDFNRQMAGKGRIHPEFISPVKCNTQHSDLWDTLRMMMFTEKPHKI